MLPTYFKSFELTDSVLARATQLTRVHALRAADAIQLACVLAAKALAPEEDLVLLSSDTELNAAAASEGLRTVDPNAP
jgi:uncharacterized protein